MAFFRLIIDGIWIIMYSLIISEHLAIILHN